MVARILTPWWLLCGAMWCSVQMNEYVVWVHKAQFAPDPNGIDVRGEPKFFLGSQGGAMGAVYNGVRCHARAGHMSRLIGSPVPAC